MNPRTLRLPLALTAALLLLGTQPGADCLSDDSSGDSSRRDDSLRRSDDRGPGSSSLDGVPRSAEVAGDYEPGNFSWTAPADGVAYIFDRDERQVKTEVRVRRGERLMIDTKDNRVRLDGGDEQKVGFSSDNRHRVFFAPTRRGGGGGGRDGDGGRPRDGYREDVRDRSDSRDRREEYREDRPTFDDRSLPRNAEQVRQARGSDLSYKSDYDGFVYLYDADNSRVIGKFAVRRGQRLTCDPDADTVTIDGRNVYRGDLGPRTRYRLYFVNPA